MISKGAGINGVRLGHHNENGDLSFLKYFSKQSLAENIQEKFEKNPSVNFISEESP